MRKLMLTAVVVGVAGVSAVGLAGTAVAAEAVPTFTQATNSYSSPSNHSARVHSFARGEHIRTICFSEGQQIGGNPNWIRVGRNGTLLGFVPKTTIGGVPGNLPHC